MPGDGTIGGLVGKLDVLRVECPTCGPGPLPREPAGEAARYHRTVHPDPSIEASGALNN
jgi:hypothetical protein